MAPPAKINLGLEVIRRRGDGFHDINTIFAAVDLRDDLSLALRDDGAITCRVEGNPTLDPGDDNLCVRAARALRDAAGRPDLGLDIVLGKHIPIGAGLGGGSSDAASVLVGVGALRGIELEGDRLARIAAELGSDVPFFLHGGVAVAVSRGEALTPLALLPRWTVLLVNPGIHIPTPWAYRMVGRSGERPATDLPALLAAGLTDPALLREGLVNDFEPAIFAEYPLLGELKERLYEGGALFALMSGSGSTMFGLFGDRAAAARAATAFTGYWTAIAGFVPAGSSVLS
jgi:4-diphosphocytidyl-2-C-methyl-D-erythritol kinase